MKTMLAEAHESLNRALGAAFAAIAPGAPIVYGHPVGTDGLPGDCWRVYWLDHGQAEGAEMVGMVQVDVFAPTVPEALRRASALDAKAGFGPGAVQGLLGVFNHRTTPPTPVGQMRLGVLERGWVRVPEAKPSTVHLARTLLPRWSPGAPATTP